MPTSNETRVRVEGFSKRSATLRPIKRLGPVASRLLQLERALDQVVQLAAPKLGARDEVLRLTRIIRGS